MAEYAAEAFTMQALVKYHGLRNWKLRLPYHDSISVNTTCMKTEATITDTAKGGVFIEGTPNDSANARLGGVLERFGVKQAVRDFRIDSKNVPHGRAKGIGYSSSAGAALTLLCHRLLVGGEPDMKELSTHARVFAASASRSLVGGFSRLYAGKTDEEAYAERFADERDMDLRMVIIPLPSHVKTEDAHREVTTSPFFDARVTAAQKRCDEMEKAIRGNDLLWGAMPTTAVVGIAVVLACQLVLLVALFKRHPAFGMLSVGFCAMAHVSQSFISLSMSFPKIFWTTANASVPFRFCTTISFVLSIPAF